MSCWGMSSRGRAPKHEARAARVVTLVRGKGQAMVNLNGACARHPRDAADFFMTVTTSLKRLQSN